MSDNDKKNGLGALILSEGMDDFNKKQNENSELIRYIVEKGKAEDRIALIDFFIKQYEERNSAPVAQAIAKILKPILGLELESKQEHRGGDVAKVMKISKWGRRDGIFAKRAAMHAMLLVDCQGKEPVDAIAEAATWAFKHCNDSHHKYKKSYQVIDAIGQQYYDLRKKITDVNS